MKPPSPPDELLERYAQAKAQLPDGLPTEPPAALHERIMRAARVQAIAINSIANNVEHMPATGSKEHKKATPSTEATNDSFWSIKAVASFAVMGLSALLWWQFEQGAPESQETTKIAQPGPAAVAASPTAPPTLSQSTTPSAPPTPQAQSVAQAAAPQTERTAQAAPERTTQASVKPTAPLIASPATQERARNQDLAASPPASPSFAAAPPAAKAEIAIATQAAANSSANKSTAPSLASKKFNAESQGTVDAPSAEPAIATAPRAASPAARAVPAPMTTPTSANLQSTALQARDAAALRQALAQGASPNARTPEGNPALTQAAQQRWAEGVRILLSAGADRSARNNKGHTAADVAFELGFAEIVELLAAPK